MVRDERAGGVSWPEAIVGVMILLILASIIFPHFAKAREKARCATCPSQVRQLATSVQMYVQDHKGQYPGRSWNTDIEIYAGSNRIFYCEDGPSRGKETINYGYSGLLLDARGQGVREEQVKAPTEVGVLADVTPALSWAEGGGIIGGAQPGPSGQPIHKVTLDPRHGGVQVGFADGHTKMLPGKKINLKDLASLPGRAFIQASPLGLVDNPAGGMPDFAPGAVNPAPFVIGGEYCTRPLLAAAAQAWAVKARVRFASAGFAGQNAIAGRKADYAWGHGDGVKPAGRAIAAAQDAVVVIVSKNCRINDITKLYNKRLQACDVPLSLLTTMFSRGSMPVRIFTFDTSSGTRTYFTRRLLGGAPIASRAEVVKDDLEMVSKVSADPFSIGYCSSLFADSEKVQMLAINGKVFPNQNRRRRWEMPDHARDTGYPYLRTLWVSFGGNAWRQAGDGFGNVMLAPGSPGMKALREGPLFRTGYFP